MIRALYAKVPETASDYVVVLVGDGQTEGSVVATCPSLADAQRVVAALSE